MAEPAIVDAEFIVTIGIKMLGEFDGDGKPDAAAQQWRQPPAQGFFGQ